MGTLYVVATPIGNLEDITLRALRILKEVDLVLCEDTRETGKLLKHYEISKPLKSYHAQSKLSKIDEIIEMLYEGKNIALVSDAGTPAISDPGSLLIKKIREETSKSLSDAPSGRLADSAQPVALRGSSQVPSVQIISIPGPSALTAAYSISGITGGEFVFLGFLPHKKGRETLFKEMALATRPYVFYESPHRMMKTLESLKHFAPTKQVFVGRELTKIYEESISGTAEQIEAYYMNNPDKMRGEFVCIVF